jgi:serine/threonine protein kinase
MEVVQKVEHPFVPFFFQIIEHKSSHTMVISEYIEGQSLYDVIREIGLLSTMDCQFYVACMISLL